MSASPGRGGSEDQPLESIDRITARMADLREILGTKDSQRDTGYPAVGQLVDLCQGYEFLVAEIEAGLHVPAGV